MFEIRLKVVCHVKFRLVSFESCPFVNGIRFDKVRSCYDRFLGKFSFFMNRLKKKNTSNLSIIIILTYGFAKNPFFVLFWNSKV